jgi:DNA invertase Pin-like site-specific DNA recombinase
MFGYSRVSTTDQDWTLQLDALIKHGVDERDIYCEQQSGSKRDRTQLNHVLGLLKDGDALVVWRLDRLARSQRDLLDITDKIQSQGAQLVSLMDHINTNSATGKLLFSILGSLAEFERNLLIERTKAGQAVARSRGIRFGRPPKLTPELIHQIHTLHNDSHTQVKDICQNLNISKSLYYNALKMTA